VLDYNRDYQASTAFPLELTEDVSASPDPTIELSPFDSAPFATRIATQALSQVRTCTREMTRTDAFQIEL
jgi:hypothetical protein